MNEHENDARIQDVIHFHHGAQTHDSGSAPRRTDLVVDLSGTQGLDVTSLALLLTAQQQAQEEDRSVWLAGVPMHVWQTLHSMGLGSFFLPFPVSGGVAV